MSWLEDTKKLGSKPGLESISELLGLLGNPQDEYKSIHVTGTNGKGSTSAITASILKAAGYRVGLFTSPHLSRITESIQVNRDEIPDDKIQAIIELIREKIPVLESSGVRHPTHFEVLTTIAFQYFAEEGVDFAVVEVGLGGRDDATNVIRSDVSIITNISLEHTHILGDTKLEIAKIKAGIIKPNTALITAEKDPTIINFFKEYCHERNSKMLQVGSELRPVLNESSINGVNFNLEAGDLRYEGLQLSLIGEHQMLNAACAIGAVAVLKENGCNVSETSIREGLVSVVWPGRLEIVGREPLIVLDGAKDLMAARALRRAVLDVFDFDRLFMVVSFSSDKDIEGMLGQWTDLTDFFFVTSHRIKTRAAEPLVISDVLSKLEARYEVVPVVSDAIERARELASVNDLIVVSGSVFLVGEAREVWF